MWSGERVSASRVVGSSVAKQDGVWVSVHSGRRGAYATDEERLEAARAIDTDEHGIFRLDAARPVEVTSFGGGGG